MNYDINSPEVGLDAWLKKPDILGAANEYGLNSVGEMSSSGVSLSSASSGEEVGAQLAYGKKDFTDTTEGWFQGMDTDGIYKWIVGGASSSVDWAVTTAATLTITGAGLVSPVLRYGKTSFTDSANAGYYISSDGVYIGAASDATAFKYTVGTGAFDFIGTVSSRSTATIASAINSSGNLVNDVINARLDSSAKTILADFNFGASDYAGAVKSGDITWNTTTGAITGGSGIVVYRGGIIGAAAGVATFSINATTGAATFAGALSAPSGNIGGFTINAGSLSAVSGGNTTTVSSGATAFSAGPTASPSVTITQAGVLTATGAVINGSALTQQNLFGDGSDGAVTFDGSSVVLGLTPSSSVYTLTRDIQCSSITVDNGVSIKCAGYRIFCTGTVTNNGTIQSNGSNASAGTGGAATASGFYIGGKNGGAGGVAGAGSAGGSAAAEHQGCGGGASGAGGAGSGGGGGSAGSVPDPSANEGSFKNNLSLTFGRLYSPSGFTWYVLGGAGGGGGGGGDGVNSGGGGGGGGGLTYIAAATITNTSGTISSNGGAGANGVAGNTGGGGGGGGGVVCLIYKTLNAGTETASAGAKGLLSGTGSDGNNGSAGTVFKFQV